MSYILQALKKSEQERELAAHRAPLLVENTAEEAGESPTDDHNVSIIPMSIYAWLGALVIILLLITVFVQQQFGIIHDDSSKSQKMSVVKESTLESVQPPLVAQEVVVQKVVMHEQVVAVQKAVVQAESAKIIAPIMALEQASEEVQSSVPNIDITSHIFSSLPGRRSIVVNGQRLVETDFIAPLVQIKEITHKGMIINVDGLLLAVDRSRGWSR